MRTEGRGPIAKQLSPQSSILRPAWLGFAQRTQPVSVDSSLFHGTERPLFIGIVEPSPFPEIAGR